jgi:hypothetical protein
MNCNRNIYAAGTYISWVICNMRNVERGHTANTVWEFPHCLCAFNIFLFLSKFMYWLDSGYLRWLWTEESWSWFLYVLLQSCVYLKTKHLFPVVIKKVWPPSSSYIGVKQKIVNLGCNSCAHLFLLTIKCGKQQMDSENEIQKGDGKITKGWRNL